FVAEKNFSLIMPGYTHKQRAQPLLFSHHIMAYFEMFDRDRGRLADIVKRVDVLPLGSGALAGVNYKIDRVKLAKTLNFASISENSVDAVSDRDFVIELISIISIIMMHFSRMSEELILWSSQEYSFIELPDRYTTGSSIMPQKKNPDMAELTRGRAGKIYGNLMAILTIMKGLPLAYNRDMQEDKPPLFESIDIVKATLKIFAPMIRGMKVNNLTMLSATETGHLTATDLADYLVVKGIPFRQAHHLVGNIVRYAIGKGKDLTQLTINDFQKHEKKITPDVFGVLSVKGSVAKKNVIGGTAPAQVKAAISRAKRRIG
ncbi:MAG: argininosuccinate lyase, partial [bacterium]